METIQKNQSEIKDTLTEMKKNVHGINNREDEAENQISNLEEKEAKKQPVRTARRKKNPKKMRMV